MLLIPVIIFTLAVFIFIGLEKFITHRERGRTDPAQDAGSLRTITILRNLCFAAGESAFTTTLSSSAGIDGTNREGGGREG